MNLDFHYYTTCFLALQAGFTREEALILAHSCQLVDDNILLYQVKTPSGSVLTQPTQNYGFWNEANNLRSLVFHFFPGGSQENSRRDEKTHPWATSPHCPGVKNLVVKAFQSKNLYRMGISLHTLGDTWAHQGFSGLQEEENALTADSLLPPIGHAQALQNPDIYTKEWVDPRLKLSVIDNKTRFYQGAKKIYRYLCVFQGRDFDDEEIVLEFWIERMKVNCQEEKWRDRVLDFEIRDGIPRFERGLWMTQALGLGATHGLKEEYTSGYSKFLWLLDETLYKNEILRKHEIHLSNDFYQTHYYQWLKAADLHREEAFGWLESNFEPFQKKRKELGISLKAPIL